jgi:hypothetical protein
LQTDRVPDARALSRRMQTDCFTGVLAQRPLGIDMLARLDGRMIGV